MRIDVKLFPMFLFFTFLLTDISLANSHNLKTLLKNYADESKLSKKTKKDTSGALYLYTREMLDKMQAKNLRDVLKTIPHVNLYQNVVNIPTISIASYGELPSGAVRIFINDHDMTSTAYGSGFLNWGDMNIEYIDHIEIYKGTSSIRFGSETAPIVIKLYTKLASREVGAKIRAMADDKGSTIFNVYDAKIINDNLSYFIYGNFRNINNDKYHKNYQNENYTYNRDHNNYNLYANVAYGKWLFETGVMNKKSDGFIDIGYHQTPSGSDMNVKHKYFQLSKTFSNDYKINISIDNIEQSRNSIDPNGLNVKGILATDYSANTKDNIYSITIDKTVSLGGNDSLFFGGFYKYKTINASGNLLNDKNSSIYYSNAIKNSIDYYAVYAEERHKFNQNISFISSFKQEYHKYEKDMNSFNKLNYKFVLRYKNSKFLSRVSYAKSFIPVQLYQVIYPLSVPYRVNSNISISNNSILLFVNKYNFNRGYINFILGKTYIKNPIVYNPNSSSGYVNMYGFTSKNEFLELTYHYDFDSSNNFDLTFYDSNNNISKMPSPQYGVVGKIFNSYNKIDFYNELVYKSSYKSFGIKLKNSYDWTSAIKYHASEDFSIGIRGENILNRGLKQAYRGIPYPIPVVEQKFWLNLEYLF